MTESSEKPIEIAGKYSTIEGLRRRAREEEKKPTMPKIEVKVETGELVDEVRALTEGQKDLLEAFRDQRLTVGQLVDLSTKQTGELVDSLRVIDPGKERERWVDVEYEQEFYTRFQPNMEPRFYTKLETKDERDLFDARWQVARAAFLKRALGSFPDKYKENQDLVLLTKEQTEKLYKMPGVQRMLEKYAEFIEDPQKTAKIVDTNDPTKVKEYSIWDMSNRNVLEQFRGTVRDEALQGLGLDKLSRKEADAVAWNLMWISNIMESKDTRYLPSANNGGSGKRHGNFVLAEDEFRNVMHPQEKFESKLTSNLEWGAFGKWGVAQLDRIRTRLGFSKDEKINWSFVPALAKSNYWGSRKTADDAVTVSIPECYPTTAVKSFWEETKPGGDEKTLWDYLLEKEPIPWDKLRSDIWPGYIIVKFNKAVSLGEYFSGQKPMEVGKPGYGKVWADPLIDIYKRLELQGRLGYDRLHNVKIWAAYASLGGIGNVEKMDPNANLAFEQKGIVAGVLRHRNVRYLDKSESFDIVDVR